MTFLPEDIDDLVTNTLEAPDEHGVWSDISFSNQNNFIRKFMEKGKLPDKSGTSLTFRVQVQNQGNARLTGMFDRDRTSRRNIMKKGSVPWSKQDASFEYDIDEEVFQGDNDQTIIDEIVALKHSAYNDLYIFLEEQMFGMPGSIEERPLGILGLPYWFPLDTSSDGAFVGMDPAGYSSVAGLSRSTYEGWRSFSFGYDAIDWNFVKQLQRAMLLTSFEAPDPYPKATNGKKRPWWFATTLNVVEETCEVLRTGNDNFGKDLMNFTSAMVNSQALEYSSYLTENSTVDDIYGVNMQYTGWYSLTGRSMRETKPQVKPGASDVRFVRIANWAQMYCRNCREGGFHAGRR